MTLNDAGLSSTDEAADTEEPTATGEFEPPSNPEPDTLSKDVVFELLKNRRRRDAIRYLKRNDGEATLSDMAEHIAAKENGIEVQALSSSQRKRVYIGLYQCHLPKMADAGVIDFEKNRGDIELSSLVEQLEPYLGDDVVDSDDDVPEQTADPSAPTLHLAAAALLGFGVAAGLLNVPVFASVPAVGWAALSVAALTVIAGLESYRHYLD